MKERTEDTSSSTRDAGITGQVSKYCTYLGGAGALIAILGFFGIREFKDVTDSSTAKESNPITLPSPPSTTSLPSSSTTTLPPPTTTTLPPRTSATAQPPKEMVDVRQGSPLYHERSGVTLSVEFFNPTPSLQVAKLTTLAPGQDPSTETVTGAGHFVDLMSKGKRYRVTVLNLDFAAKVLTVDLSPVP